jgi:hypothetical protein
MSSPFYSMQELGGIALDRPTWQTTHVVAVSAQEPLDKTEAYIVNSFKQLSQQHSKVNRNGSDGCRSASTVTKAPATSHGEATPPLEHDNDVQGHGPLDTAGQQMQTSNATPVSPSTNEPMWAVVDRATFVTSDWVSKSIAMDAQQSVDSFGAPLCKYAVVQALKSACAQEQLLELEPMGNIVADRKQTFQALPLAVAQLQGKSEFLQPDVKNSQDREKPANLENPHFDAADQQIRYAAKVMLDIEHVSPPLDGSCPTTVPGWGCKAWQPPEWTSSNWGEHGIWLEPFDSQDVRTTLSLLYNHYNRLDLKGGFCSDIPDGVCANGVSQGHKESTRQASNKQAPISSKEQVEYTNKEGSVQGSTCEHIACAHAAVCIVQEMEKMMAMYVRGRANDVHRKRAAQRAISALKGFQRPLDSDADVAALCLGMFQKNHIMCDLSQAHTKISPTDNNVTITTFLIRHTMFLEVRPVKSVGSALHTHASNFRKCRVPCCHCMTRGC